MKDNIVIYQAQDGKVELRADIEKDTIWAAEAQIAELFATTQQNVNLHLKNIYLEGELDKRATHKESLYVQKEGTRGIKRQISSYNLDAIIAVGYRVNSKKATQFRIWATGVLREYLKNGYAFNKYKLDKSPESLVGLYDAVALLESKDVTGKLKGTITLKLTKYLEPSKGVE